MRKPFVDITVAGSASGLVLGKGLKSFTYRDHHHGEVDEVTFSVADPDGRYRAAWVIDEGTEVEALLGFEDGAEIQCGRYVVDDTEASGDGQGDIAVFRALSAFTSKELRTKRSEAFDDVTLEDILKRIADRHELELIGEIPDIRFKRITQTRQGDLAFMTRLAEDYGCYFSVKGDRLVFTDRALIESAAPVRTFNRKRLKSYRLRRSTHKLFAKARLEYLNAKTKRKIIAEAHDERIASGDTLKLDDKVENQEQADRLCLGRLLIENDAHSAGRLSIPGDPNMVAGQVVALDDSFGRYEGRWLITTASHKVGSGGYATNFEIKSLEG